MRKSLWPTVLLAFLIACGGGGPDEPDLSVFTEQTVAWESCDAQLFEEDKEALAPILERLECATVQTPLDWENPELESVNLGVLRVRAADPAKRKGAIALNPGGPGGDGLFIAAIFGLIFAEPDSERVGLPERASFAEISESYDIIGSSPRGVGESFRLYCGSNRLAPANYSAYDTSEDNLDDILLAAQYEADACQANPLTKYIDTEQTARDMDLIRQLLGDEKLNYLGFSYGSWLGAWYAKLFPGQAGNIVLDGNLIFSGTWQDVFELDANSFNRAFEDVALAMWLGTTLFTVLAKRRLRFWSASSPCLTVSKRLMYLARWAFSVTFTRRALFPLLDSSFYQPRARPRCWPVLRTRQV